MKWVFIEIKEINYWMIYGGPTKTNSLTSTVNEEVIFKHSHYKKDNPLLCEPEFSCYGMLLVLSFLLGGGGVGFDGVENVTQNK